MLLAVWEKKAKHWQNPKNQTQKPRPKPPTNDTCQFSESFYWRAAWTVAQPSFPWHVHFILLSPVLSAQDNNNFFFFSRPDKICLNWNAPSCYTSVVETRPGLISFPAYSVTNAAEYHHLWRLCSARALTQPRASCLLLDVKSKFPTCLGQKSNQEHMHGSGSH